MKHSKRVTLSVVSLACGLSAATVMAAEGDAGRRIEEVVVTAERRESTVQDTAISITALNAEFIEDFGLRNQEDLQNYLPATVIQPYDISVRGIGRLFRAAGGDPGVATYFNGAYSEDFGIASTEGGLYDMERVEVLRGPQGTLYGRNGIGGAVNFHSARPTFEFESELRALVGNFDTREAYGFVSGPLIDDTLAGRFTFVNRFRDGTITDLSANEDLGNYGDESYAMALLFTPLDNLTIHARGNERSYRRRFSGASGAGSVVMSEAGGLRDAITGGRRNTTARVFGYRTLETYVNGNLVSAPTAPCASFVDRVSVNCTITPVAIPAGVANEYDPTIYTFSTTSRLATSIDTDFDRFTNDAGGFLAINPGDVVTRRVQRVVPGVDLPLLAQRSTTGGLQTIDGFARPNWAFGHDLTLAEANYVGNGTELVEVDGDELVTDTNGVNDEQFDHQNITIDASWDVSDLLTVKYIGAYTDYIYHRNNDDDRSSNTFGGLDMQFVAIQENENFSHELQFWFDFGEDHTVTSGMFYYTNQIDQRLDFFSKDSLRFNAPARTAANAPQTGFAFDENTARDCPNISRTILPTCLTGVGTVLTPGLNNVISKHVQYWAFAQGSWVGDQNNRVQHGSITDGTSFIWDTENVTEAFAVYGQWEWQINEQFALTLGGRWSKDDKQGFESLFLYREGNSANLLAYNVAIGALNPDGTPTAAGANETIPIRFRGVPNAQSLYRQLDNSFEEVSWRVNFDYTPVDDHLFYFSTTTGYRAGGFNLGFYSAVPTYDPEEILAFEIGHKGQFFDGTLQANSSIYFYQYEDIHLQQSVEGLTGLSTSVFNGPEAENYGFETDITWLPTEEITLGINYSYTKTEYTEELIDPVTGETGVVIQTDPNTPPSVFEDDLNRYALEGKQLNLIGEHKYAVYGIYSMPLASNGKVDFLTSYSWQDDVSHNVTNTPLAIAPAFGRWDARVTWTSADERYEVQGFVNNILDEIGIRQIDAETEAQNFLRTVEPTLPRVYGLDLKVRFQ